MAALAGVASLAFASGAGAETIEVDVPTDSGGIGCELREAIGSANADLGGNGCTAGSGVDLITFDASLTGHAIDLDDANGDLIVMTPMNITGPGMNQLTIDGPTNDRVLMITAGGTQVEISGLTVQGGDLAEDDQALGGGIRNDGDLELTDVKVANNSATANGVTPGSDAEAGGGGIYSGGELLLNNAVVSNNSAIAHNPLATAGAAVAEGGGIQAAAIELSDTTIAGNSATATDDLGSALGDAARALGGGISTPGPAGISIDHSTVSGNQAAATSTEGAAFTWGGGLKLNGNGAMIELSTIANNTTSPDGATADIQNGGGITGFGGTLGLISSTVAGNGPATGFGSMPGANLDDELGGLAMTLQNAIVADPRGATSTNCFNSVSSNGHNLDSDDSCNLGWTGDVTGDPNLDPLADNGGPTMTMAIQPGAALDAGNRSGQTSMNVDQRGLPRPVDADDNAWPNADGGDASDIGAFEAQPPPVPTITGTTPASPSAISTSPLVMGTAPGATQGVSINSDPCTGLNVLQAGNQATFEGAGLSVNVPANATTNLRAASTNEYSITSCSAPFAYTHFTPSVPAPPTQTPTPSTPTTTTTGPTGQRAAALKKCSKKRSKAARKRCRKAARKLPV